MPARMTRRDFFRMAGAGAGALAGASLLGGRALAAPTYTGVHAGTTTLKLANVRIRSIDDELLLGYFDDTHAIPGPGLVEVLLWPGDQAKLEAAGLEFEITVEDVVARDQAAHMALADARPANVPVAPGERTAYRRIADYNADMQLLAQQHPDLARTFVLPNQTLEGRLVYGIEIAANVTRNDGRPVYHMDGCHHSREWPAGEMPMMFAFDLIEGYGVDARTTDLLDRMRVVIVPVMNVDGFVESRDAAVDNSNTAVAPVVTMAYWRKNRRSFTGATIPVVMKNPDAYGVDPNRNYSYQWGDNEGGSSSTQVDETMRGAAPFSEPESRNIRSLVMARQTTGMLTHHTHGRLCMRPWGWTWDESPDNELQFEIGEEIVAVNHYQNIQARGLYLTSGGSRDWTYGATGCITYTFEHGTAFHPPYLSTIPAMYNLNREPFFTLFREAADPSNHGILKGKVVGANGQPLAATITVHKEMSSPAWFHGNGTAPGGVRTTPDTLHTSMETGSSGVFDYHVNPSRRPWLEGAENEAYQVMISAEGKQPHAQEIVVSRGDVVDLGTVQLS
jgi:zinc carboxypeptidase